MNRAERQAYYWIFGGIYRPVYLEVLPKIHISRVAIDARADGSFKALIETNESQANLSLQIELFDMDAQKVGKTIKSDAARGAETNIIEGKFENILAWNPEWPNLYDVTVTLQKANVTFDSDGDHAPDGILGPYREKGGSFNTIKEIWSPVQVVPMVVPRRWSGRIFLENKFIYTNLNQCSFEWQAVKTEFGGSNQIVISIGTLIGPDAILGETTSVLLNIGMRFEGSNELTI